MNTVSTHIRSIYAKLGADDRSAAVRRARELRLLAAQQPPAPLLPVLVAIAAVPELFGQRRMGRSQPSSARALAASVP